MWISAWYPEVVICQILFFPKYILCFIKDFQKHRNLMDRLISIYFSVNAGSVSTFFNNLGAHFETIRTISCVNNLISYLKMFNVIIILSRW